MSGRLNYYFRQKVSESEMDLGFTLLEQADRDFVTDHALVGVVNGMVVTQRGAGANMSVDVSAGVIYDKNGQRINTSATQNVDVSVDESSVSTTVSGGANSKVISVFAKFQRVLTDPRTDGNSVTVFFSEAEGFAFVVRQSAEAPSPSPTPLDGEFILLADITRAFGQTTIVNGNISVSRREDVFVRTGGTYSLRRGRIGLAFQDVIDDINAEVTARGVAVAAEAALRTSGDATNATNLTTHISNPTAAHAASAISYGGSGNWNDATTVSSSNVESAIDEVVSDLAGTGGDVKIGSPARGASFVFGLSSGSIGSQLLAIQAYLDLGPFRKVTTYTNANTGTTLTTERQVIVDTSGGACTLKLPAPSHGREFHFKDPKGTWSGTNFTLQQNASEKIENVAASRVFSGDFTAVRVFSNGTDWFLD